MLCILLGLSVLFGVLVFMYMQELDKLDERSSSRQ